jgi:hypothetical protein
MSHDTYNYTACDVTRCSGHGRCLALYEQCDCDEGWGFPNCRGDFTTSSSKAALLAFNIITIIIVVVGIILSTWRIIVLWKAKRASAPHLASGGLGQLLRGVDSQLGCNFCIWFCLVTCLPMPTADIFENVSITYNFVYTTESLAALGCAFFIRVFALMVAKTSSSTQRVVRGLDYSMWIYMIGATASNLIRTFTSQQTSTLGWWLVVFFDVGYTLLLLVGSFVYSHTVLKQARRNVARLLATAQASPATLSASVRATAWSTGPLRTATGGNGVTGGLVTVPEKTSSSPRSNNIVNNNRASGHFVFGTTNAVHTSPGLAAGAASRYAMTTSPGGSGERPPSSPAQHPLTAPSSNANVNHLSTLEGRPSDRRSTLPLGTTGAFFGKALTINVPASPRVTAMHSPTNTITGTTSMSPMAPLPVASTPLPTVVVQTIPTPSAASAVSNLQAQQSNLTAVVGALHGIQITGGVAILFTIAVSLGLSHEKELWASILTLVSTYYVPIVIAYLLVSHVFCTRPIIH